MQKKDNVRTHQQITFISLNRFCLLSDILHPLLIINEHNQAGWENTHPFQILFQVLKVLIKIYKIQRPGPFFFLLYCISFYISRHYFSQHFRTLFNIIKKEIFVTHFPFLMHLLNSPHHYQPKSNKRDIDLLLMLVTQI